MDCEPHPSYNEENPGHSDRAERANGEYLKLSKDPVIFGEIISGDFLQSAIAAIGIPQFANGPLFTSFIAIHKNQFKSVQSGCPPSEESWRVPVLEIAIKDVPEVSTEKVLSPSHLLCFITTESVTLASEPASKSTKLTKHFF